jgi:hypothetical protein
MTLAVWLALAPLRLLAALGLRRSLILVCLFVLAVTRLWGGRGPGAAGPTGGRQTWSTSPAGGSERGRPR